MSVSSLKLKRFIQFCFYSLILISLAFAGEKSREIKSKITAVTVYTDRAMVTRTATVSLNAGEHLLTFAGLPESIEQKSIQVRGIGNALLKDVRFRAEYFAQVADKQMKSLYDKQQKLEDEVNIFEDKISQAQAEKAFVEKIAAKLTGVTEKGAPVELDPEKWIKLTRFYRERFATLDKEIRDTEINIRLKEEELDKVEREIALLGDKNQKVNYKVQALVEMKKEGKLTLNLTYLVYGPYWYPHYDLRVATESKKLNFTYNAFVVQNTSENWDNVQIKLSTAMANLSGNPPVLQPWHVRINDPVLRARPERSARSRSDIMMNQMMPAESDEDVPFFKVEKKEMAVVSASLETKATSVEFVIGGLNTITNDNQPHKLTVMIEDFDATFRYSSVPKLAQYVYLKAQVTNSSGFPLLGGETNIFMDNHFVSTSELKTIAPGEKFWTFLGVDEGMKVEYKFINKFEEEAGLFSKTKNVTFEYRIEVTSNKINKEELVIWDQLPISTDEKIIVELIEPEIESDKKNIKMNEFKFIEWYFLIEPGQKIIIPLKYQVEYPKEKVILGL